MYNLPVSDLNRDLATSVNRRIKADSVMLAAKAACLRLAGLGLCGLMLGAGGAACLWGYSYVHDSRTSADQMAAAFSAALEHANLGTVRFAADATVRLDPKATVKLEPGQQVSVAPGGTVRVIGFDGDQFTRPTQRQLQGTVQPPSNVHVVTDFTVFKTTRFGAGAVYTGWDFQSNEDAAPRRQFCYYTEDAGRAMATRISLATDRQPNPDALKMTNFDANGALSMCQWFN
jgi:hypothetical protein